MKKGKSNSTEKSLKEADSQESELNDQKKRKYEGEEEGKLSNISDVNSLTREDFDTLQEYEEDLKSQEFICVALSTDGRWASTNVVKTLGRLAGGDDKSICIWNPLTGECEKTLEGHTLQVSALAWSPDGRLASGGEDKIILIWNPTTGKCEKTLKGHTALVFSVAWSADADGLASGSKDKTIKIWNPTTGECQKTLKGHTDYVDSVAWSSDGRLASGSSDGTIRIWNPKTGECQKTLNDDMQMVWSVAWSSDGRLASGSWDRTIRIWNPTTGECEKTFEELNPPTSVAWSSDRLASSSLDNFIRIWNPTTGECEKTLNTKYTCFVISVAWNLDGRSGLSSWDNTMKVWNRLKFSHKIELDLLTEAHKRFKTS